MNPVSFFASPVLNLLAWSALLSVPPAIILLYFLKLRREPLEVPSTYLWRRTIEDLHVNSLWQRLRRSLLLFLQLLLAALVILACLRPGWRGARLAGDRFIFLIDTSASMSAADVAPNRLEAAKEQALRMIGEMKDGDAAMILSASNTGRIEQAFTENRRLLRKRLREIQPTRRTSDLDDALRYAAGLANPGRSSQRGDDRDVQVAEALPAAIYIFSDGAFQSIPDFSLGNLTPHYIRIGSSAARNLAVAAFSTERNPERPDQMQAFARLANFCPEEQTVEACLYLDGQLLDAQETAIAAGGEAGLVFDLFDVETGVLKIEIRRQDDLPLDNVAYAAVNRSQRARVLVVTPGNPYLRLALSTQEAAKLADVTFADPTILAGGPRQTEAEAVDYDLILYDRCQPPQMPEANTFFIGALPPVEATVAQGEPTWSATEKPGPPVILYVDRVHPLMQFVQLGNVSIIDGFSVHGPNGTASLIESNAGPLLAIAPRRGFEDAVLGFAIVRQGESGGDEPNTDWPRRRSFPVFWMNVLSYLGGGAAATATPGVQPGEPCVLRAPPEVEQIQVASPSGQRTTIRRDSRNAFVFAATEQLGVYDVYEGSAAAPAQRFPVNLFDRRESNLAPRETIELGYETVPGRAGAEPVQRDLWKWILVLGLAVLLFEWYIYNRRVYL